MEEVRYSDRVEIKEKTVEEYAAAYYRGERISNALIFFIGLGALFWTFFLFLWRQGNLSTGLFISSLPFSIFYISTGAYRFIRSISRFNAIKQGTKTDFLIDEIEHLMGRSLRFKRKRRFDVFGILIGFCLIVWAVLTGHNHIFLATAISIVGFSTFLLIFDLFGQFRTEEWLRQLKKK